ncbi:MAG TPA: nuclear transport factor 2 family protein [Actinomycetota bacterium]|nr:nuclear transport factor 2 family protein [Actinomycetota bacterium]
MDVAAWLEAYRVAWERRDPDAAADLFADASTYRANIFEDPFEGTDGVRRYWADVTASQSDVEVRIGRPYVDGDRVAAEFWTTMRVAGDEVTLPGCLFLRFDGAGRCTSLHEYWQFQPERTDPPPEWGS